MEYQILCQPSYAMIEVQLERNESITAESGAMAWMDPGLETKTQARGGIAAGLKRKLLAGESFFQNTYTASHGPASITLCAGAAGDVVALKLDHEELVPNAVPSSPAMTMSTLTRNSMASRASSTRDSLCCAARARGRSSSGPTET